MKVIIKYNLRKKKRRGIRVKTKKFTVADILKKVMVVTILLVAMTSTMVGCGMQEHNNYVGEINSLGDAILDKYDEVLDELDELAAAPNDMERRRAYGMLIGELGSILEGFGEIVPIEKVSKEHQELVEVTDRMVDIYIEFESIMMDEDFDFTSMDNLTKLVEILEEVEEVGDLFEEKMDQLIDMVNN